MVETTAAAVAVVVAAEEWRTTKTTSWSGICNQIEEKPLINPKLRGRENERGREREIEVRILGGNLVPELFLSNFEFHAHPRVGVTIEVLEERRIFNQILKPRVRTQLLFFFGTTAQLQNG